jgi:circadian clock protein KaiC
VREFLLTDHGIGLMDVYVGPKGVLTGSAKAAQELQDQAAAELRLREADRKRLILDNKKHALEAKIAGLRAEFEAESREVEDSIAQTSTGAENLITGRHTAGAVRGDSFTAKPDSLSRSRGNGSTKRSAKR